MFNINPYNIELPDAWQKEIIYQKAIAFVSARQYAQTMNNILNNTLDENDFIYRDIIFKNQLPIETMNTSFDYLKQHYRARPTIDTSTTLKQAREECQNKKMVFWKKCVKLPIDTQEKLQCKKIVSSIKTEKIIVSQLGFITGSLLIAYLLRMYRNPIKFQVITLGFGSSLGYLYGLYNYSNQIFNEIPKLPNEELENERQHIVNYCYSLDSDLISKNVLFDINFKAQLNQIKN